MPYKDPDEYKEWYEEQKRNPKFLARRAKYFREWRKKNPDKYKESQRLNVAKRQADGKSTEYQKKYFSSKENRRKRDETERRRLNSKPWMKTRKYIFNRLYKANVLKIPHWRTYIGIKLLISSSELKDLWFRDKAYDMKKPSIDRIDPDGHYTKDNCRYIESAANNRRRRVPPKYCPKN